MITKDTLLKRIGLIIVVSLITMLAIITVEVFFFSSNSIYLQKKMISPQEQIKKSEVGRALINIHRESQSHPEKAQEDLKLLGEKEPFSTIETIYAHFIKREIAQAFGESTLTQTQHLAQMAELHDIAWLQAQLKIEQAERKLKQGEIKDGIEDIQQAINLAEEQRAEFLLLKAYNTAGALYNASNQLKASQLYFYKGLELGKQYPLSEYNGRFYNNLGLLYVHLEQWTQALEYLEQALVTFENSNDAPKERLLVVLFNQSFVYTKLEDPTNARKTYQDALAYFDEQSDAYYQVLKRKVEARLLLLEKKYQQANTVAFECQNYPEVDDYPKQKGICQLTTAKSFIGLGDFDMALSQLKSSIDTFNLIEHDRWLIRAYKTKAEIYELQGNATEALRIYKKYNAKEREQFVNEIYALEFAFDTQEMQQERDLLSVQNELSLLQLGEEKLRFRILALWGAIALLLLVLAIWRTQLIRSQNVELQHLSYHDPLTGVNNRRYYQKQIDSGSVLSKRALYRVVLIDLDWFKTINDTHGHDVGDEVLVTTALRLKRAIHSDELLIRWGGEEFLCLLNESADTKPRVQSLLRLINESPYITKAGDLNITISIGVSKPNSIHSLQRDTMPFVEADTFLYQSKQNGRNQVTFPDS
ncbi:diguanylate cyclase [uncultured Vibrio sp.]|uniref:tetratricopeptide repeat-containing diguanylate cyclase n=1 Tax=uncultured Vibrio sp. TaxID=114054 RepID=UPI0025F75572|nr:diguanylate cyclase [uncultured Vibrio sp.]